MSKNDSGGFTRAAQLKQSETLTLQKQNGLGGLVLGLAELGQGQQADEQSPRFNQTAQPSPLARHKESDNFFNMIDAGHIGAPSTSSTKNKSGKVITLKAKSSLEFYSLKSKAALLHTKNNKHIKNSAKKPRVMPEPNTKRGGQSPKKKTPSGI